MYIIETLKQKYPSLQQDLEKYDTYLRRCHNENLLYRIYDDSKENFKYIDEACSALTKGERGIFQRKMCIYEKSLNDDPDFLDFFINAFFNKDSTNLTVEEKHKLINDEWIARGVI